MNGVSEVGLPHSYWIFDCDGVLLDSNGVKTAAFRDVALRYGTDIADDVVRHHLDHGGISRHVKLARIFDELLQRPPRVGELDGLLRDFGDATREGLLTATVAPAAASLLQHITAAGARASVVSGGLEEEVRWILTERTLAPYFDGIHGSPTSKHDHVGRLVRSAGTSNGGVLVGDSREDLRVALEFGLRPVFVSQWSEFRDWQAYLDDHADIVHVHDLGELLDVVISGRFP